MLKKNNFKYYIFEIIMCITSVLALFCFRRNIWIYIFMLLILYVISKLIFNCYYKKSRYEDSAFFMIVIFSFIYIVFYYCIGLYFGYYYSTVKFGFWALKTYIIPYILIIYVTEKIRHTLLIFKDKLSIILSLISLLFVDIYLYIGSYDIEVLDDFAAILGFVILSSFINNLFYHYYSGKYRARGIIFFRCVTILYPYVIPITPDVYMFFRTFLRMIYAYIMYYYMHSTYTKVCFIKKKTKDNNMISTIVVIIICALLCSLVSCQFKYGAMVVASESMHGKIEKGDVVIFEKYNNNYLKKNDIILFEHKNIVMIHRIINIRKVGNTYHYITKGDANDLEDEGYSTKKDIRGKYMFRIRYVGYPTLWIRDIFK